MDVSYNNIGKDQALNLVEIFKQKDQMKSVGLARCNLGIDGAKAVADYVSVSASLTSVTLLANKFDHATVSMLLKLKEEKPALTTLCGLKPDQKEAAFRGWELTSQDAKLLAPEIAVHASLTKLDVRYNSSMGEEGKAALRKAVEGRSGFELIF